MTDRRPSPTWPPRGVAVPTLDDLRAFLRRPIDRLPFHTVPTAHQMEIDREQAERLAQDPQFEKDHVR